MNMRRVMPLTAASLMVTLMSAMSGFHI